MISYRGHIRGQELDAGEKIKKLWYFGHIFCFYTHFSLIFHICLHLFENILWGANWSSFLSSIGEFMSHGVSEQ